MSELMAWFQFVAMVAGVAAIFIHIGTATSSSTPSRAAWTS
jgi:hypothetical protein